MCLVFRGVCVCVCVCQGSSSFSLPVAGTRPTRSVPKLGGAVKHTIIFFCSKIPHRSLFFSPKSGFENIGAGGAFRKC